MTTGTDHTLHRASEGVPADPNGDGVGASVVMPEGTTPGVEVLAFRYRLFPTPAQERMFLQTSGCARKVYNLALEAREAAYMATGKTPSSFDLIKRIPGWKKAFPFLKAVPAQCLQAAIADLGDGWARFFRGQNEKPTWRRHAEAPRFRLPQPAQFRIRRLTRAGAQATTPSGKAGKGHKGHKTTTRHLFLPKMGMSGNLGPVHMTLHRPLDGRIRSVTIKREGGLWYASFTVERPTRTPPARPKMARPKVVGADRNVRRTVVTSDGLALGTLVATPKDMARLARLQRVVAHKQEARRARSGKAPGESLKDVPESQGLKRAKARVAKVLGRLARRRKDQAHKIARALVDGCDILVLEDLDTKAMTGTTKPNGAPSDRTPAQRREVLDVAWGMIGAFCAYKAWWANKRLVRVNPAFTSQRCAECHHVAQENRNRAHFHCVACGHTADADVNAARNIRALGLRALGLDPSGRWPEVDPGFNQARPELVPMDGDDHDGAVGCPVPQMRPEGEARAPIPNAEPKHLPSAC